MIVLVDALVMVYFNNHPGRPATSSPFLYIVTDGVGTPLTLHCKQRLPPTSIGSTSSRVNEDGSVKKRILAFG